MHPNPAYRYVQPDRNLQFAADTGFGVLAVAGEDGMPLLSHIPFVIEEGRVLFHLVRSNPIARVLKSPTPAKLAVQGPHSYISPDWYGIDDQVPTWNYVAVHLSGPAELLPQDDLLAVLEKLSDRFESKLAPKPIWKTAKMPAEPLDRLMRQIVPCAMDLADVQGTWKLTQNKVDSARLGAAEGVAVHGLGTGLPELAALMRNPPVQE
ncbi:FMN-binding negative transcriptional regulator [Thalassovita sp.]|uniref:FMN-binding negative transcriptional regulator n=1 Tax=Thalassovita sp. TaxID=1979401 RepID=UPI0029DE631F|nr:FMN-binding negative transcriptional regulator [Thalassovita sp.]